MDSKSSIIRRKTSLGLIFTALLIGFVVGGALDAAVRPNQINLEVDPHSIEINVVPKVGDVIHWVPNRVSNITPEISFVTGSPCKEKNGASSVCTVEDDVDIYRYKCDKPACEDPGVDPRSTTGPGFLPTSVPHLLFIPFDDIGILFKIIASHASSMPDENKHAPAPDVAAAPISINCPAGTPVVYNDGGKRAELVAAGQTIYWQATPWNFSLGFPDNTCKEQASGPINTSNPECTLVANLTGDLRYSVTLTPRSGSSDKCDGVGYGILNSPMPAQPQSYVGPK